MPLGHARGRCGQRPDAFLRWVSPDAVSLYESAPSMARQTTATAVRHTGFGPGLRGKGCTDAPSASAPALKVPAAPLPPRLFPISPMSP
jgi:hypothetical protein